MSERGRQAGRELAVLKYCAALDEGDLELVQSILEQAETDPFLERMLLEVNTLYRREQLEDHRMETAEVVRELLRCHMPSALAKAEEAMEADEVPPVTVAEVVARMQSERGLRESLSQERPETVRRLQEADAPLPEALNTRGVRKLLEELGVRMSERFQMAFRETAIFLSTGRRQHAAHIAVARRQRQQKESTRREAASPETEVEE